MTPKTSTEEKIRKLSLIKARRAFLAAESAQASTWNAHLYADSQILDCSTNSESSLRWPIDLLKSPPQGSPLSFSHLQWWQLQPSGCSRPNPWSYPQQLCYVPISNLSGNPLGSTLKICTEPESSNLWLLRDTAMGLSHHQLLSASTCAHPRSLFST